eukprot:1195764-Amphidinium_carterae.2
MLLRSWVQCMQTRMTDWQAKIATSVAELVLRLVSMENRLVARLKDRHAVSFCASPQHDWTASCVFIAIVQRAPHYVRMSAVSDSLRTASSHLSSKRLLAKGKSPKP